MRTATPIVLGLLLLSACNDASSLPAVVPMNAQAWSILYSPGMPPHPTPQASGGWYFDFPSGSKSSVNYVLAAVNMAASSSVHANISVNTTGKPSFVYNLEQTNNCTYPAHVRLLLQEKGDDLSGRNGKQYFRWWSTTAYQLAPGSVDLKASLTDLSQWVSVFGEKANASAAATAGFKQAMARLGNVGFAFGGGCFYGHGVRVSGGAARFAITGYEVK